MPERSPGLVRPPALNTGESRTASRLELFFDLAYVVAVAELARAFASDLTWHGAAVFVGLFTVIWSSWVGFTLYANRFDTDDVVFRLIKLAATLTAAGCAASAADADSSSATAFGASFLAGRVLLVGLYLRAWRHLGHVRTTTTTYLVAMSITCGVWAVSLTVGGAARYACWALAILIDAATPVVASLRGNAAPLHVEHLPERFALLVILVLGEAVAGLALAVHDAGWAWRSVTLAAAAFVAVGALWWNYFDAGTPLGEENLEDLEEEAEHTATREEDTSHPDAGPTGGWPVVRARLQEDLFVYGHLPVTFGVAATAVGLEEMALHPQDRPAAASWSWSVD